MSFSRIIAMFSEAKILLTCLFLDNYIIILSESMALL